MHLNRNISFPDEKTWNLISRTYQELITDVNDYLKSDDDLKYPQTIETLYELVWGTLEYLESDAMEFLSKGAPLATDQHVKKYLEQLLNFLLTIEEFSFTNPSLTSDRYVLY